MIADPTIVSRETERGPVLKGVVVRLGRLLFMLIFLMAAPSLFTKYGIAYAAAHGVPLTSVGLPLARVTAIVGGLSILLGYRVKTGAWHVVLFLVAVTPSMHRLCGAPDLARAQDQLIMLTKILSILGSVLPIAHFGAGPLALDLRRTS